ncbi:MAG TPA: ATP-binding cassette domain-containing protein [Melioribacteraceae bacterium]|nr:ATP-binding cassette domain-containing protein [Melioribacteraceae bacterium]
MGSIIAMVELKNISLSIRDKVILKDFSFRIEKNKTTVIVGPSGAGKSSILRIIAGLWRPDSGEIIFNGENVFRMTEKGYNAMRKKIGIVFQSNALFDSLTVNENILYFLPERKSLTDRELLGISERLLSFVNMEGTGYLYPEELSGGMKKRIAIARALAFKPKLILFDEPTTGLDPLNSEAIIELIEKLKNKGTTSVVVSHILNDVMELGEQILFINNGRIVETGTIDKIVTSEDPLVNRFFYQLNRHNQIIEPGYKKYELINA